MNDGGLKVGDLYVAVTASIGEAVKNLGAFVDAVEETADEIEANMSKAAAAIGDFSTGMLSFAGVAAGAVALAGETSSKAADELEALKKSVMLLGREVGELFLPLVRQLTDLVKTAIATWRGLDASLKQNLVTAVKYAAVIGVAGMALERTLLFTKSFAEGTVALIKIGRMVAPVVVSAFTSMAAASARAFLAFQWTMRSDVGAAFKGLISGLSGIGPALKALPGSVAGMGKSFLSILPQIVAVLVPLLAVAAAVGGIVLFAGSLYKSWDDLTYLFRESTSGIVEDLQKLAERTATFFGSLMQGVKDFISKLATAMLDAVFSRVKQVAKFMENVARTLGRDTLADNLAQVQSLSADAFMGKLKDGAARIGDVIADTAGAAGKALSEATKDVREGVAYGLRHSVEGAQQLGADLAKALHLDELMALKDRLLGAASTLGDGTTVNLPVDRTIEVGKVDAAVELPASIRALATGKDPVMKAYLDMLRANAKATAEAMQAALDAMRAAASALKSKLASRMGEITDVIDSVGQGFAAGGFWGALIALVGELLTRSEGFKSLIGLINNLIQLVADSLGKLLTPLAPLVGAISMVAQAVVGALMPIFTVLVRAFEPFVPVLVMVANLVNALAPLLQMFAGVMQLLEYPMRVLVNVALRGLFEGIKWLSIGVLEVARGIGNTWNGIVTAVQGVLYTLGNIEVFGGKPFGFLLDWGTALNGATVDTYGLMTAIGQLHDTTWETAQAQAEQAAAVLQTTAALDKATASLTNVPSSWKYALRSFEAQNARSGAGTMPTSQAPGSSSSTAPSAPAAPAQPSAPAAPLINSVIIHTTNPYEAMSALERKVDDMAYRSRGSRGRGGAGYEVP
ncbi:hypothetical protein ACN28E_24930 [Archangium lansingense]|uniref:hypothetical protein n=1 Tax=Archangium lansingense TaxID=2995310 RepID=UPI003B76F825